MNSIANQLAAYIDAQTSLTVKVGTAAKGEVAQILIVRESLTSYDALDDTPDDGEELISIQSVNYGTDKGCWDNLNTVSALFFPASGADFTGTFIGSGRTVKAMHNEGQRDLDPARLSEADIPWFRCELKVLIQHST